MAANILMTLQKHPGGKTTVGKKTAPLEQNASSASRTKL